MSEATSVTTGRSHQNNVLEIRDVSVAFDMDRGRARVVDEVSMDIERGEVLGVVGESGSGKSMFASSLLDAVVDPGLAMGEVTYYPEGREPIDVLDLDDEELRQLRWEEISMVFQGALDSFNPTLSIRGHFLETLNAHSANRREGLARARRLLSDLYMDPDRVLDAYPHELSGGMKQRALIALSLVLEPEILIMDEPTAALDLLMQRSILQLLDQLQEEYSLTMIFITHDLPLVTKLADRMAIMYAFEFIEIGSTRGILENAVHPYTRLLLKSTPNLSASIDSMDPIEGLAPDPVNVPGGCRFHPRCPLADAQCEESDPELQAIDAGHEAACFYWEQADEAVPTTWMGGGEEP